ncbi:MAG TPA: ComEC/Rec2 family competence protein, partial [Acidobacteriaceae bacterium]|nr:ComEC/Rec2 family competence protein [Acidobacteriaceae bacterium]
MESAPAFFAGLCLCSGILIAQRVWIMPGQLLVAGALLGAVTLLAIRVAGRIPWLPLACCWVLLGAFLNEVQIAPDAQRQLAWLAESGDMHTIDGHVDRTTPVLLTRSTRPFSTAVREERTESVDIRIASVDGMPVAGGLRASIYAPSGQPFPEIRCGDSILASLVMRVPERYEDPGVWDSKAWLSGQGVGVVGALRSSALHQFHAAGHPSLTCRLHALQQAGTQRLMDFASGPSAAGLPRWLRLSVEDAGMLSAMVLGDRTYLNRQARVGFERTGSFHLLVVSGMHLALFAGFIFAIAALLRSSALLATALTIACSFAYALLTGFGAPVQRSFWMVALFLVARLLFRERNSLNAVGFAALCLLAWNPRSLLEASFQMTLLAVLVIAGIVVPIAEHTFAPYLRATRNLSRLAADPAFPPRIAQFRVTLRLISGSLQPLTGRLAAHFWFPAAIRFLLRAGELLLVSACIELAMSLPMAVYFHRITLLALPVNIFIVPLIAVALPAA